MCLRLTLMVSNQASAIITSRINGRWINSWQYPHAISSIGDIPVVGMSMLCAILPCVQWAERSTSWCVCAMSMDTDDILSVQSVCCICDFDITGAINSIAMEKSAIQAAKRLKNDCSYKTLPAFHDSVVRVYLIRIKIITTKADLGRARFIIRGLLVIGIMGQMLM